MREPAEAPALKGEKAPAANGAPGLASVGRRASARTQRNGLADSSRARAQTRAASFRRAHESSAAARGATWPVTRVGRAQIRLPGSAAPKQTAPARRRAAGKSRAENWLPADKTCACSSGRDELMQPNILASEMQAAAAVVGGERRAARLGAEFANNWTNSPALARNGPPVTRQITCTLLRGQVSRHLIPDAARRGARVPGAAIKCWPRPASEYEHPSFSASSRRAPSRALRPTRRAVCLPFRRPARVRVRRAPSQPAVRI